MGPKNARKNSDFGRAPNATPKDVAVLEALQRWRKQGVKHRHPLKAVAASLGVCHKTAQRMIGNGVNRLLAIAKEKVRIVDDDAKTRFRFATQQPLRKVNLRTAQRLRQATRQAKKCRNLAAKLRRRFSICAFHEKYGEWPGDETRSDGGNASKFYRVKNLYSQ